MNEFIIEIEKVKEIFYDIYNNVVEMTKKNLI